MSTAASRPAGRALVRDRLTWSVYGLLAVYGFFLYGFGASLPLLRVEQDVSRSMSALHSTALVVGSVVTGTVGAAVVRRYGRGAVMRGRRWACAPPSGSTARRRCCR